MKILAIETSTPSGSAAVVDDLGHAEECCWEGAHGHAGQVMTHIATLLKRAAIPGISIDAIAVAIGPGSFTGLRVGLATAKGLAMGWGKPLVTVSSLAAMVGHVPDWKGLVAPAFDARRGEIYAAAFQPDGAVVIPEQVITAEQWIATLTATGQPCCCLGDGYLRYRSLFEPHGLWQETDVAVHTPRATLVAALAMEKFRRNAIADLDAVVPNYLRRTYAEENKPRI